MEVIGHMGLPVAMIGTDDEDQEGHIMMRMREPMNLSAMVFLSGFEQWRKKFELGGLPETPNLFNLSAHSCRSRLFVPRRHCAAFDAHDYVKCIHVLVPQIENSLRELLKILGVSETKTDAQGGFDLKNMNDILHEPLVRESFEDQLWFFLKAFYVEKRGTNLRNLIAHGIAPVEAFNCINAGLVVQSIVLLSAIRPEGMQLAEDGGPNETSENSE